LALVSMNRSPFSSAYARASCRVVVSQGLQSHQTNELTSAAKESEIIIWPRADLCGDHALRCEIGLVAGEGNDDIRAGLALASSATHVSCLLLIPPPHTRKVGKRERERETHLQLLDPDFGTGKGVRGCHVVDDDGRLRAAVVHGCQTVVPLLHASAGRARHSRKNCMRQI
jgi:hypothetical protein